MRDTVALVVFLLTPGFDAQTGDHHRHIGQHRDQQQDLNTPALTGLMHTKAQPEKGAFDVAKTFFDLHALPVDGDHFFRLCRATRQVSDQNPGFFLTASDGSARTVLRDLTALVAMFTPFRWPMVQHHAGGQGIALSNLDGTQHNAVPRWLAQTHGLRKPASVTRIGVALSGRMLCQGSQQARLTVLAARLMMDLFENRQ